MNYKKALDKLRKAADEFDYEDYLERSPKEFQVEPEEKVEREGLVRRPREETEEIPMERELGLLAERFIQIRRMRSKKTKEE